MPSKPPRYLYWCSCVFLDYISNTPGRAEEIKRVWDDLTQDRDNRIVTCTLSIVEVTYTTQEKTSGILEAEAVARLDTMWNDPAILFVEMPQYLMTKARDLMRSAKSHGANLRPREDWNLKPGDAMHLAAAMWVHGEVSPVSEFHTYDERLFKYQALTGFPIHEPHVTNFQQTHFLDNSDKG